MIRGGGALKRMVREDFFKEITFKLRPKAWEQVSYTKREDNSISGKGNRMLKEVRSAQLEQNKLGGE